MEEKFSINNISEKQARIMIQALDLYSRLMMGQVGELDFFFRMYRTEEIDFNELHRAVKNLKTVAFPNLPGEGSAYSITSEKVPDESRVAFDLLRAIRHCLAWTKTPEGGWTVDFDPLDHTYGSEPFITVKKDDAISA